MAAASLPYHEPGIVDLMILSSFLLVLNLINSILDRTLYCGLVGQVLIGVAWGTPGAKWLSSSLEDAVVQLGYLGLIMIVFEGGLSTSVATMRANLLLSVCVALTGIAAPMALSFFLAPMVGASFLQCFAAGAALCSTSLGTTFTVLGTSGLVSTRLGSVLTTAAMMDDVVGLVMVQIVSSLGNSTGGSDAISPATVLRPVLVSLAFAVLIPLACRLMVVPLISVLDQLRTRHADSRAAGSSKTKQTVFVFQTMLLFTLVIGASYAGASVLLAAYLAGVVGAWWDSKAPESSADQVPMSGTPSQISPEGSIARAAPGTAELRSRQPDRALEFADTAGRNDRPPTGTSTSEMYQLYYAPSVERVLKPFFFASIGFSIPISRMFTGSIVWRGIVYSVLMLIGKALCGLWLVRLSISPKQILADMGGFVRTGAKGVMRLLHLEKLIHQSKGASGKTGSSNSGADQTQATPLRAPQPSPMTPSPVAAKPTAQKSPERPLSLYPAGIMAFAMIARGEIGFLISSVAESNGMFRRGPPTLTSSDEEEASEIFLIVTWAIVLCTIVGPLCVGLLVRRVKKLEANTAAAHMDGNQRNVLGAWGVS